MSEPVDLTEAKAAAARAARGYCGKRLRVYDNDAGTGTCQSWADHDGMCSGWPSNEDWEEHLRAALAAVDALNGDLVRGLQERDEAVAGNDYAHDVADALQQANDHLMASPGFAEAISRDGGAVAWFADAVGAAMRERREALAAVNTLAAENQRLHTLLADVMESLQWTTERDNIVDRVYEAKVEAVCNGDAYGALMDAAQRCWRRAAARRGDPVGGEHVAGPCRATVDAWLRKWKALQAGPQGVNNAD